MRFGYGGFMELRHLRYFVVVAEEQNVTRAAERLHVSQPALSRQIHDLEDELGVMLFRRTPKSLALTDAGKVFLREARAVVLRADQAVEAVRAAAANCQGHLRIGYAPSLTAKFLPEALRRFEAGSPGVRVSLHDLSSEECRQRLAARKLDLALSIEPSDAGKRGLVFEKVTVQAMVCAVATTHPLARRRSVAVEKLKNEDFVVYAEEDYPEYVTSFRRMCLAAGFKPRITGEYDGATGLITAVESGRGIALVAETLQCMAGSRLAFVKISPGQPVFPIGAVYLKPSSELVAKFIGVVKEAARV
jgi:DNA-binding transcriptional LysR family regulator